MTLALPHAYGHRFEVSLERCVRRWDRDYIRIRLRTRVARVWCEALAILDKTTQATGQHSRDGFYGVVRGYGLMETYASYVHVCPMGRHGVVRGYGRR